MTKEKHKVLTAMFDVIPVGDSGNIDVSKITSLQSVLNLGRKFRMNKNGSLVSATKNLLSKKKRHTDIEKNKSPSEEFELFLNKDLDIKTELVSVGVEFRGEKYFKPRYRPVFAKQKPEIFNDEETDYQTVLAQINLRVPERCQSSFSGEPKKIDPFNLELLTLKTPQETHASKELDMWVKDFSKKSSDICSKKFKLPRIKMSRLSKALFLSVGFGLVSLTFFGHYGISIKNQLVIESNSAVANLQSAGENIKNMDFASASDNFAQAYKEFSKAGDDMNFMGAGISSLLSDLPGFDKLTAGGAGKLKSKKNLGKAKQFLADVDDAAIPEDKKASFEDFKLKLPVFEKLVNDSVDYSKFLEDFIGTKGIKKYLILFQNPSELRPTGGFPGTYGIISFKDGKLQDFKVD